MASARIHAIDPVSQFLIYSTFVLADILSQANTYKLDHIGMNPSAESYLVLHRFGVSIFSLT